MKESTIFALIAAVGTFCAVAFGYAGYQRGVKKEAREDGSLKADVQYIRRIVEDILFVQRNINNTLSLHNERITRTEESVKQAHKRIDETNKKLEIKTKEQSL